MEKKRTREEKSQETREKVLFATEYILREKGYEYLTIRNICAEGDVAYGSFYHHFGSKEELLYGYCRELLKHMLEVNSMPEELDTRNIIHEILWAYDLYAAFCEAMGKGAVRDIYTACAGDLFEELCFEGMVMKPFLQAAEDGYILGTDFVLDISRNEILKNIRRDLNIQLKGAVLYWATVRDEYTDRGLQYLIEGPINRFMMSWTTPKYAEEVVNLREYRLLSEQPWFEGSILVPFEPTRE